MNVLGRIKEILNNDLSEYNDCIIAGGATSNLLMRDHFVNNAPINDIDIYRFIYNKKDLIDKNLDGAIDSYSGIELNNYEKKMSIISTKRIGLINLIEIEVNYEGSLFDYGIQLINGFDLNCVKTFLLIDSGYLFIDNDFKDFLKTKQIKIIKYATPIKSILRAERKRKELKCFLSKNHIESIYQLCKFKNTRVIEETYKKYLPELDSLREFFFFYRGDKYFISKNVKPFIKLHKNEEKLLFKDSYKKYILDMIELKLNNDKFYLKYEKLRPYYKTFKIYLPDLKAKLKNDFNEENIVYIEKILRITITSKDFFQRYDLSESINLAKSLSKYEDEGFLYKTFIGKLYFMNKMSIDEEFKKFKKMYNLSKENLIEPLSFKFKGIQELVSMHDLNKEGSELSHCVASYSDKLIRKEIRLFSITVGNERSTLELSLPLKKGIQHRGKNNSFPGEKNREVAIEFINYLIENNKI